MNNELVCGVGVYEKGEFVATKMVGNKQIITKEYSLWSNMLERCYSDKFQLRRPTYVGCYVSDNFKNFQYFAGWCQFQIGFKMKDYQLDKDILIKCNKGYSESNCVFVPREINKFLANIYSNQGNYPVGVSFHKVSNKYKAQLCIKGKNTHLGLYNTPEEAFQAYKTAKEAMTKELVTVYEGFVGPRVIEALNNYVVKITD